jgi:hypothetical protein
MVTALVAGILLSGAPQAQTLDYKPKNYTAFGYAARVSELLQASDFKVGEDGLTFTWTGPDSEVRVNESEGIVHITSAKDFAENLPQLMSIVDIPTLKCRVTLTMKRTNEADQTISADVSLGADVKIGGGFGRTEVNARTRRNGDGTYTVFFNMSRDFGAATPKRQGSIVVRMKSGDKVSFSAEDHDGKVFTKYSLGGEDAAYQKGGVAETGVSFEASVSEISAP